MKKSILFFVLLFILSFQKSNAQTSPNWTKDQLLEPAALAQTITTAKETPVIFSVGPGALIPHSITIGMTNDKANVDRLKKQLKGRSKTSEVVIYCGCCPFEKCPNVRPAIDVLKELHFTSYKLLNLPHNLKADWIDKGYPIIKQ